MADRTNHDLIRRLVRMAKAAADAADHLRKHLITSTLDHTFPGGSTFLRADGTFASPPSGGTPPTGTGFRHITVGAEDAASKLVENADVHASAGIAESKLALAYATHSNALDHSNANDPTAGQKAALAGTSGTPAADNKFVTNADVRMDGPRTPLTHANEAHDPGYLDLDHALDIKLDDFTAPDDNADLNATVVAHGLLPKLGGGTTNFLRADGTWAAPAGGGSDPWTVVKLANDFTSSLTANTNVTGLFFTPAVGKTYVVYGGFLLRTATATVGARPGIAWPTVSDGGAWIDVPNSLTAAAMRIWGARTTQNAASTGLADTASSHYAKLEAIIVSGASPSGNFQITLASETAGTNVTMRAGSYIAYREI